MKTNLYVLVATTILQLAISGLAISDAGKTKAEPCFGCHAIPNYSNPYPQYRVPKLAGQRPEYIVEALKAYQSSDRQHPTMNANASALSEQDMQDIAAFLSAVQ